MYRQVDKLVENKQSDGSISVLIRGGKVPFKTERVKTNNDLEEVLQTIMGFKLCVGATPNIFNDTCSRYLKEPEIKRMRGPVTERCASFRSFRDNGRKKKKMAEERQNGLVSLRTKKTELKKENKKLTW